MFLNQIWNETECEFLLSWILIIAFFCLSNVIAFKKRVFWPILKLRFDLVKTASQLS